MRTAATILLLAVSTIAGAQSKTNNKKAAAPPDSSKFTTGLLAGLSLRSIGPALTSGRVSDIAIDASDKRTWYVAAASGGVWKSTNCSEPAGTVRTPGANFTRAHCWMSSPPPVK